MTTEIGATAKPAAARRTNWKSLLILGSMLLIGALAIRWNATRNRLDLQATRLPNIDSSRLAALADYQWLSPHELLVFDYRRQGIDVVPQAVRIDAHTGTITPLTALNERLGARLRRKVWHARVSPDGRRLLFQYHLGRQMRCMAATLDGSQLRDWSLGNGTGTPPMIDWLPDGHHCGYVWYDPGAHRATLCIYALDDLTHPALTKPQLPPLAAPGLLLGFDALGSAVYTRCTLPSAAPTIVPLTGRRAVSKSVSLAETVSAALGNPAFAGTLLLVGGKEQSAQYDLKLPQMGQLRSMTLSPQGDRIALILSEDHPPQAYPWMRFLRSFVPAVDGTTTYRIWECRTDGGNLHPISPEALSTRNLPVSLAELRWLPDGKQVSFLYNNALYTLPAD